MDARSRVLKAVAGQLGHPRGVLGRRTGRILNQANAVRIRAAVDSLALQPGAVAAHIGFGGGAGLDLLLDRVGTTGRVHGIDPSVVMVTAAGKRLRRQVDTGRLVLHTGAMESLPLPPSSLDASMSLNTVYFIRDLTGAFRDCAPVLRPGGQLVVGLGDPPAMERLPFTSQGFHLRPVVEVEQALATQEFQV